MSLWRIALRSIQHRLFPSLLTMISMALGVTLVVVVLSVHGVMQESFTSNASLGYNMIVGAKGGKLQLTLNTVYYLSSPVENIPYEYYLEFLTADQRDREITTAVRVEAEAIRQAMAGFDLLGSPAVGLAPASLLGGMIAEQALERGAARHLDRGRPGKFAIYTEFALPVCLGDYLGNFRVVGTVPELFERLRYGEDSEKKYAFKAGRNFQRHSEDHGYFEAVLGSTVARELKLKVGDPIAPAHGSVDGHKHAQQFTVVGILAPTGTPNDRAAFINMEGFYLMEEHAEPVPTKTESEKSADGDPATADGGASVEPPVAAEQPFVLPRAESSSIPLPLEQRKVTSLLVLSKQRGALSLQYLVGKGKDAQAIFPLQEILSLFTFIVTPLQRALLFLTAMICVVSGTSILVSIYNSMSERKREIAVIRALGAGRSTVMTIILLESIILAIGGGLIGWTLGHSLNAAASGQIEEYTGVSLGFFDLAPGLKMGDLFEMASTSGVWEWKISPEVVVLPALILLAIGSGFLPALSAYRTDVSRSLGS
ncbi:MAG: ABC transporter permease [Planctomycetes bacterium]|nr:ABC transporter permease [Planctomycetota bacterium]